MSNGRVDSINRIRQKRLADAKALGAYYALRAKKKSQVAVAQGNDKRRVRV